MAPAIDTSIAVLHRRHPLPLGTRLAKTVVVEDANTVKVLAIFEGVRGNRILH